MDAVADLARYRDRQVADLVALVLGLAAQTNPDILRHALASVFDTSQLEETSRRMMLILTDAQAQARAAVSEVRILVETISRDLDRIDQRIDQLNDRLDERGANGRAEPKCRTSQETAARP